MGRSLAWIFGEVAGGFGYTGPRVKDRWSPGDRVADRYRLDRKIGVGSFSTVWRATDETTGQNVALKALHQELPSLQRAGERLAREAELLLTLDHPNIAGAQAFLEADLALVMEHVEGQTLRDITIDRAKGGLAFSLGEVARLGTELLAALEVAHTAGVVHRDLKPANLMISPTGQLKVLDFGIAKLLQGAGDATTIGRVLGTWLYMSPEQARGETIDHRADLFAVGVLLFELLTLRRPFALDEKGRPLTIQTDPREVPGNSRYEILQRLVLGPRPRLGEYRAEVPEALEQLIERSLSPEPDARPISAAAMALALVEALPELTMTRAEAPAWSEAITRLGKTQAEPIGATRVVGIISNRHAEPLKRDSSTLDGSTEDGPSATQTKWVGGPTTMLPRPQPRPRTPGILVAASLGAVLAVGILWSRSRAGIEVEPAPHVPPPLVIEAPPVGAVERPRAVAEPVVEAPTPPEPVAPEVPPRRPPAKAVEPPPRTKPSRPDVADRLAALIEVAAKDPDNSEPFARLARALKDATQGVPEPERSKINRCITSAELGGRLSDLRRCHQRWLEAQAP